MNSVLVLHSWHASENTDTKTETMFVHVFNMYCWNQTCEFIQMPLLFHLGRCERKCIHTLPLKGYSFANITWNRIIATGLFAHLMLKGILTEMIQTMLLVLKLLLRNHLYWRRVFPPSIFIGQPNVSGVCCPNKSFWSNALLSVFTLTCYEDIKCYQVCTRSKKKSSKNQLHTQVASLFLYTKSIKFLIN